MGRWYRKQAILQQYKHTGCDDSGIRIKNMPFLIKYNMLGCWRPSVYIKRAIIYGVTLMALLSGCALHPRIPYDPVEKVMLATAIGGQVGDYVSSQKAFSRGCVEGNPLLQSNGVMIGAKVAVAGMTYLVSNACDSHRIRKVWLGLITAIGWGATWHNETIDCGGI